jgi:hypothetical protein
MTDAPKPEFPLELIKALEAIKLMVRSDRSPDAICDAIDAVLTQFTTKREGK